jgi:hypothetical protein
MKYSRKKNEKRPSKRWDALPHHDIFEKEGRKVLALEWR